MVATPLGNLHDIGVRAVAVLKAVDVIAAEDTRHSQRLLDAFGITTRLVALHEHNEQAAAGQVIRMLEEGKRVALITDAGSTATYRAGNGRNGFVLANNTLLHIGFELLEV